VNSWLFFPTTISVIELAGKLIVSPPGRIHTSAPCTIAVFALLNVQTRVGGGAGEGAEGGRAGGLIELRRRVNGSDFGKSATATLEAAAPARHNNGSPAGAHRELAMAYSLAR
jgi:hypothetical protein